MTFYSICLPLCSAHNEKLTPLERDSRLSRPNIPPIHTPCPLLQLLLSPSTQTMDDTIERPSKRPRLSNATAPGSQADNLDLQKARHRNDLNLKSIFENIFAKYENDFTEVGDEIDLETGELVVNNGHIGLITETSLWDPEINEPESDGEAYDEEADGDVLSLEERDFIENIGAGGDAVEGIEISLNAPTSSELHDRESKGKHSRWDFPSFENEQAKPVDPIWNAPDFDGKLSTPTLSKPPVYPTSYNFTRSASPLGASDIWALPKKGRPSTGGVKRYKNAGPKKKRKPRASAVTTDWSFAEISDGNDSDDPLNEEQDDLQSPTPKGIFNLRGRKAKPVARDGDDITEAEREVADANQPAVSPNLEERDVAEDGEEISDTKIQSNHSFATSSADNMRSVTEVANIQGHEHDITESVQESTVNKELTNNSNNAPDMANTEDLTTTNEPSDNMDDKHGTAEAEALTRTDTSNNTENIHSTAEVGDEDDASVNSNDIEEEFEVSDDEMELVPLNGPASSTQPTVPAPNESPNPPSANTPEPNPNEGTSPHVQNTTPPKDPSPQIQNSTPPKEKPRRRHVTPDEAKLIIKLRHFKRVGWEEILKYFPGWSTDGLSTWDRFHWIKRLEDPPLCREWTYTERVKLDRLKDLKGISWTDIRRELPGRLLAEVEFELLKRWYKMEEERWSRFQISCVVPP